MKIIHLAVFFLAMFESPGLANGASDETIPPKSNLRKRSQLVRTQRGDFSTPRSLIDRSHSTRRVAITSKSAMPIFNKEIVVSLPANDNKPPALSSKDNPSVPAPITPRIDDGLCVRTPTCNSPDPDNFQFCLEFEDMDRIDEFVAAAGRFERLISNDLTPVRGDVLRTQVDSRFECPCGIPDIIDDVYVCVKAVDLGGPSGVLARAATRFRRDDGSAILGFVQVDSNDLFRLNERMFSDLVAHELGHVLGLVFGFPLLNARLEYVGAEGIRVWQEEWGCEGSPPVQTGGGHWDERCFTSELMTPSLGSESEISSLTIAALKDRGYPVNEEVAREFAGRTDFLNREACCNPSRRQLQNEGGVRRHAEAYHASVAYSDLDTLPPVGGELFEEMRKCAEEYLLSARKEAQEVIDQDGVIYTGHHVEIYAFDDDSGEIVGIGFE